MASFIRPSRFPAKQNKVGTTVISQYDYSVNAIGQRTAVSQAGTAFLVGPDFQAGLRSIDWGYDSLDQVTSADSTENTSDRAYQYDTIGNRKKTANNLTLPPADNYTANALNQYSAIQEGSAGVSPAYDFDGNAKAYPLPTAPNANSTLSWDAESRLIETQVGTSGPLVRNYYDAQSRRVARTVGTATTLYLYDNWNVIAEYQGSAGVSSAELAERPPALSKTRLWGLDLSGTIQGAGGVSGLLSESLVSGGLVSGVCYPTYDGNGNVSEYLTTTGAVTAHFEYDPFGNIVKGSYAAGFNSSSFKYKFSTKPLDSETGLYYYGYRYYDPRTGRWPSRDPIEEEGGANLYGFVKNSTISEWDMLGLQCGYGQMPSDCDGDPDAPNYRRPDISDNFPSNYPNNGDFQDCLDNEHSDKVEKWKNSIKGYVRSKVKCSENTNTVEAYHGGDGLPFPLCGIGLRTPKISISWKTDSKGCRSWSFKTKLIASNDFGPSPKKRRKGDPAEGAASVFYKGKPVDFGSWDVSGGEDCK